MLLTLIAVDITIGPLVTTYDLRPAQKKIKERPRHRGGFATRIPALRIASHLRRQALIVFNIDRFDAVPASAMNREGLRLAAAQGNPGLPWLRPRIVAAMLPTAPKELSTLTLSSGMG